MPEILVPIFVCVVLPVMIVLIVYIAAINADNKRANVLIKAIEVGGGDVDPDKLAELLNKSKKSDREILNLRLLRGCIFTLIGITLCVISFFFERMLAVVGGVSLAVGISYLIVFFVTRRQVEK